MGGRSSSSGLVRSGKSTFGIKNATRTNTKGLGENGIPNPTNKDIQITVKPKQGAGIVFQFRLTKDNEMSIRAYDPNEPDKAKVSVTTKDASLDSVIKSKTSSDSDKRNAQKIKQMINQTSSGITQSSLKKIANELIMEKNK